MKKIASALLVLLITGCTTLGGGTAAPQSYRIKGEDQPVNITGRVDTKTKKGLISGEITANLIIYFDGNPTISGALTGQNLAGEFNGQPFKGRKTAASCTSTFPMPEVFETRCIVFIDNERTVTLTF